MLDFHRAPYMSINARHYIWTQLWVFFSSYLWFDWLRGSVLRQQDHMNRNLRNEKRLHFAQLSILHNEDFSLYDLTITKRTCERGGLWKFAVYWFLKLFFTDRYMYLLRKPTKSDGNGNLWLTINKNRVRTIFFSQLELW